MSSTSRSENRHSDKVSWNTNDGGAEHSLGKGHFGDPQPWIPATICFLRLRMQCLSTRIKGTQATALFHASESGLHWNVIQEQTRKNICYKGFQEGACHLCCSRRRWVLSHLGYLYGTSTSICYLSRQLIIRETNTKQQWWSFEALVHKRTSWKTHLGNHGERGMHGSRHLGENQLVGNSGHSYVHCWSIWKGDSRKSTLGVSPCYVHSRKRIIMNTTQSTSTRGLNPDWPTHRVSCIRSAWWKRSGYAQLNHCEACEKASTAWSIKERRVLVGQQLRATTAERCRLKQGCLWGNTAQSREFGLPENMATVSSESEEFNCSLQEDQG